jgi:hypothetical protein
MPETLPELADPQDVLNFVMEFGRLKNELLTFDHGPADPVQRVLYLKKRGDEYSPILMRLQVVVEQLILFAEDWRVAHPSLRAIFDAFKPGRYGVSVPGMLQQGGADREVDALAEKVRRRAGTEIAVLEVVNTSSAKSAKVPAIRAADPRNALDDDSMLSPREMAEKWGVLSRIVAVQSALKRWREQNPNGSGTIWAGINDPKPRQPKYFYRVGPARPVMDRIKNGQPTTSEKNIIQ